MVLDEFQHALCNLPAGFAADLMQDRRPVGEVAALEQVVQGR